MLLSSASTSHSLVLEEGWLHMAQLPVRLQFGTRPPSVEWLVADGSSYDEPFFEQTLRRLRRLPVNAAGGRTTGIEHLSNSEGAHPQGFIFHVSRCGSTLLSRMLAAVPGHKVVSEAPVLDDILRRCRDEFPEEDRVRWFRGAIGHLIGPGEPGVCGAWIKLDAWHIFELDVVRRAFPRVPLLFLYRDVLEVMVSLMRMPSLALVRDTATPEQLCITREARDRLTVEEHAAAVLAAFYRAAVAHRSLLTPVPYEALPDFVWTSVPGCDFSTDDIRRLRAVASRHSKDPSRPFIPDSAAKRRVATPTVRSACGRWADAEYARWVRTA